MWALFMGTIAVTVLQSLAIGSDDVKFMYPAKVRGERDLSVCEPNEVCSALHRRFFQQPAIQRLCRCTTGLECPWRWSWGADNRTMPLDNRAQLKFCESVSELSDCTPQLPALSVIVRTSVEHLMARKNKTLVSMRQLVTASCRCASQHYWQYYGNDLHDHVNGTTTDTKVYRCANLKKCTVNEFCGFVRADTYSTYYRCSCPTHHMCLYHNRTLRNVTELLYKGQAYEAVCTKNSNMASP